VSLASPRLAFTSSCLASPRIASPCWASTCRARLTRTNLSTVSLASLKVVMQECRQLIVDCQVKVGTLHPDQQRRQPTGMVSHRFRFGHSSLKRRTHPAFLPCCWSCQVLAVQCHHDDQVGVNSLDLLGCRTSQKFSDLQNSSVTADGGSGGRFWCKVLSEVALGSGRVLIKAKGLDHTLLAATFERGRGDPDLGPSGSRRHEGSAQGG
jgi:hypothetical protein